MTIDAIGTELRSGSWDVVTKSTRASFTVRKLGLHKVRGTISVEAGQVTIVNGEPVAAMASLEAASISTGIKKRDIDLTGRHFFATADHPQIVVRVSDVRRQTDGWTATATLEVAGGQAPVELTIRRQDDSDHKAVRVIATGVLDRAATPIRAPRFLVGRWVEIEVDATLRLRP